MTVFILTVILIKLLSDHKPNIKETVFVVVAAVVWLLVCSAFIAFFIILNAKPR